ncbi:GNAT family N-acetyltransferase [Agaribacterium haliotis]|uniref:GNAT family N-acetyltransferase n=1 Tax=Agaribacterium haliotis TaxID=2013869 RepID=UPI000BB55AC7|nr:GNAT family N-acetyltransferase [Agaribacterium haliotis]
MTIRAYQSSDYQQLVDIYAQSKLDELRFEQSKFTLLALPDDNRRHSSIMQAQIFVYADIELQAFIAHTDSDIRALYVKPKYRGQGLGKTLLRYVLTRSKAEISLNIAHSNLPARTLYEQHGFRTKETFWTDYNGVAVLAETMVKAAGT